MPLIIFLLEMEICKGEQVEMSKFRVGSCNGFRSTCNLVSFSALRLVALLLRNLPEALKVIGVKADRNSRLKLDEGEVRISPVVIIFETFHSCIRREDLIF